MLVALEPVPPTRRGGPPRDRADRLLPPQSVAQGPLRTAATDAVPAPRVVCVQLLSKRPRDREHLGARHRGDLAQRGARVAMAVLRSSPNLAREHLLANLSRRALANRRDCGRDRRRGLAYRHRVRVSRPPPCVTPG